MPLRKQSIGVLMVLLLLTGVVWAQVSRGTITGIVTDPSGAAVPGVAITITNIETGVANKVKTNESGMYTVPLLEGANYRLSAEKTGFKRYEQTGILVQSGGTARIDFSLSLGSAHSVGTGYRNGFAARARHLRHSNHRHQPGNGRSPPHQLWRATKPADFMQLAPGVTGRGAVG